MSRVKRGLQQYAPRGSKYRWHGSSGSIPVFSPSKTRARGTGMIAYIFRELNSAERRSRGPRPICGE